MSFWHHHVKNPDSMLRIYAITWTITVIAFVYVAIALGPAALLPLFTLVAVEVTFSFDNAVVNAKVLQKMSPVWQRIFMTVGIAVAVIGMRMLFPILMVALTAHLPFGEVIDLALHNPLIYQEHLHEARWYLIPFGMAFLMMIALDFAFEEKDILWLKRIERSAIRVGEIDAVGVIVVLGILIASAMKVGGEHELAVLLSGVLGLLTYLTVRGLGNYFESKEDTVLHMSHVEGDTVKSGGLWRKIMLFFTMLISGGLVQFLYLETLDASFSFDGVIGAFAITDKVLLITAGLGIGAVHVRSLTVHIIRHRTLAKLRYLEHAAHWAIGTLSVCLLLSLFWEIPEMLTGVFAISWIIAGFITSRYYNRKYGTEVESLDDASDEDALPV